MNALGEDRTYQLILNEVSKKVISYVEKLNDAEKKALREITFEWDVPFNNIFSGTDIQIVDNKIKVSFIIVRLKTEQPKPKPKPAYQRTVKVSQI